VHDRSGDRYAIFGGADHKTGQEPDTESRFTKVESALRQLVPSAAPERRWSGQVIETDDGLPFIGQVADHQYIATGFAGNGLTFGTLAGVMLRHAIVGSSSAWRTLFDPRRKPSSISEIVHIGRENLDYPTYMIRDRLRPTDGSGIENVPRGGGKVITIDGQRVAVHRTNAGQVIAVSAKCTHLGCFVRWNDAERTWDCPCHGSRFTPEGLVVGGPAEAPLERVDTDVSKRRAS
jgi:Rieske Fe-S protein